MKVLLLSAYHAVSHQHWAEGLMRHCADIDWTLLTLPPRHFSWRLRGNSLSWAMLEADTLNAPYDAVLATAMTDLSALRGMVPALAATPCLVYFHENQFAYPASQQQRRNIEPCILNLYTAMAADKLLFNSAYNLRSMQQGVQALLRRLPDYVPSAQVMSRLQRAEVLPVGIEAVAPQPRRAGGRLSVLWNHRWEYDKGPALLLAIVQACAAQCLPLDFHIVGQQFRHRPPEFDAIARCIQDSNSLSLANWGPIEGRADYQALLGECDVVLSTALHDFQGLSVLEAVAAGCSPLLPQRLCYPEYYGEVFCYGGDGGDEAAAAASILTQRLAQKRNAALPVPRVDQLYWTTLAPRYRAALESLRR